MTILPKAIYRFNATPIKLPKTRTEYFKICMETQKTLNSQSNVEKEKGNEVIRLTDFRQYYKATVIKTIWYWHKNRNTHQEFPSWRSG